MNLYLLDRRDHVGYDENAGFVIAAPSEDIARSVANNEAADEGSIWVNHSRVDCTFIGIANVPDYTGVILESFNAG